MMFGKAGKVCSVLGCRNYEIQKNSRTFCRFPRDKKLCDLWVSSCNRSDLDSSYRKGGPERMNKYYRICADHFLPTDFRNPRQYSQGLKPGVVPTQRLPNASVPGSTSTSPVVQPTEVEGQGLQEIKQEPTEVEGQGLQEIKQEPMESSPADFLQMEIKTEETEFLPYDSEQHNESYNGEFSNENPAVIQDVAHSEGIINEGPSGSASTVDQNSGTEIKSDSKIKDTNGNFLKINEKNIYLPKQKWKLRDKANSHKRLNPSKSLSSPLKCQKPSSGRKLKSKVKQYSATSIIQALDHLSDGDSMNIFFEDQPASLSGWPKGKAKEVTSLKAQVRCLNKSLNRTLCFLSMAKIRVAFLERKVAELERQSNVVPRST